MSGIWLGVCCVCWPGVRRRASQGRAGADAGRGAACGAALIKYGSIRQCSGQADRRITTGARLSYGKRRESNRWPLRPEGRAARCLVVSGHRSPGFRFSGGFARPGESTIGHLSGPHEALALLGVQDHLHASRAVVSKVLARSANHAMALPSWRGRIGSTVITWLQITGGLVVSRHWCTSRGQ